MARRALRVSITLDVETVSSPGVWLCPRGMVYLQVYTLDQINCTKGVPPFFPLKFYDRLQYQQTICGAGNLPQMRDYLSKATIRIELKQSASKCSEAVLAVFRTSLADLLYPMCDKIGKPSRNSVSLLMDATECFPGTLAPKIEVDTTLIIHEMINYPLRGDSWILDPKSIYNGEDDTIKPREKGRIYQKAVCHSKQSPGPCFNCKNLTPKKYHTKSGSTHHSTCKTSGKENVPQSARNFSTTTFSKSVGDPGSSRTHPPEDCTVCTSYERKMEALSKRSLSLPRSKYHYTPAQNCTQRTCPHRKTRDDNSSVPNQGSTKSKSQTCLSTKFTEPTHKCHCGTVNCPNTRRYHTNPADPSTLKARNERFMASVQPLTGIGAPLYQPPKRHYHTKTADTVAGSMLRAGSERFLASVLPDEALSAASPKIFKTSKDRNCSKRMCSGGTEQSKLKCCTNCYCIVCSKCKQKVKLHKSVCSSCKIKA